MHLHGATNVDFKILQSETTQLILTIMVHTNRKDTIMQKKKHVLACIQEDICHFWK